LLNNESGGAAETPDGIVRGFGAAGKVFLFILLKNARDTKSGV
jgi:hypothetical protein